LTQATVVLATSPYAVAMLHCEMQKS